MEAVQIMQMIVANLTGNCRMLEYLAMGKRNMDN